MVLRNILQQNINPFIKLWFINYENLEKKFKGKTFSERIKKNNF